MDDPLCANRSLWDEWTEINARSQMYDLPGFLAGRSSLHDLELSEVGDVAGKSLLHLQCHFGMDTLSWARLGAQVTGVDFSPKAVALARKLAAECGQKARFIECSLFDLPDHLDEQFDIVFTSYGVLAWMPDLRRWAEVAARYVKPGGFFYIVELHPIASMFDENDPSLRFVFPYFADGSIECASDGSYSDRSSTTTQKVHYEWCYPLGSVITSLIEASLQIEYLHEFPYTVYEQYTFLETGSDGLYRLPGGAQTLPMLFSLKAVKPG